MYLGSQQPYFLPIKCRLTHMSYVQKLCFIEVKSRFNVDNCLKSWSTGWKFRQYGTSQENTPTTFGLPRGCLTSRPLSWDPMVYNYNFDEFTVLSNHLPLSVVGNFLTSNMVGLIILLRMFWN